MLLNVGCGEVLRGEVRLDIRKTCSVNILADAHHLPFQDQSFDVVTSISVLEHLQDWSLALREIFRVARCQVVIEVPVNSDLRITEFLRLLFPSLRNLQLFMKTAERAREHIWQFDPWILLRSLWRLAPDWNHSLEKQFHFYCGVPSRCWRLISWRDD